MPESELPSASLHWAKQLAAGPTAVLRGAKRQANLASRAGIAAADAEQVATNNMIWETADRERGIAAFLCDWTGLRRIQGRLSHGRPSRRSARG